MTISRPHLFHKLPSAPGLYTGTKLHWLAADRGMTTYRRLSHTTTQIFSANDC